MKDLLGETMATLKDALRLVERLQEENTDLRKKYSEALALAVEAVDVADRLKLDLILAGRLK